MRDTLFTIGHSNHSQDAFSALLLKHGITAVCDVRSKPYSRFTPHFNREPLKLSLTSLGIQYVFLGRELGARSEDPSCYDCGKVRYGRLAETALFRQGLERIRKGMKDYRIALMCAEKEPLECHRSILVARHLADLQIQHILADGSLEDHAAALTRLSRMLKLPEQHLFLSAEDLLADAYHRQESRIAYDPAAEATPAMAGAAG